MSLSPHIFSHLYTAKPYLKIEEITIWAEKIGKNPIFLEKEQTTETPEFHGYILPSSLAQHDQKTQLIEIVQTCPTLSLQTLQVESEQKERHDIFLVRDAKGICGWCDRISLSQKFAPKALPKNWNQELGTFLHWIHRIAETADEVGCRVSLVGGAVRDILYKKQVKDLDFLVQGSVFSLVDALVKKYQGMCTKEPLFEAAHWSTPDRCTFDFTIARREWYPQPAQLPQTQHGTLRDDIMRRDFSINALVINLKADGSAYLIDAVNGIADLQKGELRVLHPQSFSDDPTRIFRAARYASRYNISLERNSLSYLQKVLEDGTLQKLSTSRLGKELQRIFEEADPSQCWKKLRTWKVISYLFPATDIDISDVQQAWITLEQQQLLPSATSFSKLCWLHLAHHLSSAPKWLPLMSGIKGGKKLWTEIASDLGFRKQALNEQTSYAEWGETLYRLSPEAIIYLYLWHPKAVVWWLKTGQSLVIHINGSDLIQAGCPQGPLIRKALLAAQRSAWLGENTQTQLQKAKLVWTETSQ